MSRHPVELKYPDGSTYQITHAEALRIADDNEAFEITYTRHRKIKAMRVAPDLVARGLSCRVGEYLASLIAQGRSCPGWARVMLNSIRMRPETLAD